MRSPPHSPRRKLAESRISINNDIILSRAWGYRSWKVLQTVLLLQIRQTRTTSGSARTWTSFQPYVKFRVHPNGVWRKYHIDQQRAEALTVLISRCALKARSESFAIAPPYDKTLKIIFGRHRSGFGDRRSPFTLTPEPTSTGFAARNWN
jgi:hypothetical protein